MTKKTYLLLLLVAILNMGCDAQNSVKTNNILQSKTNLFGVESNSGKLLIDTIYGEIRVLYENSKLVLPISNKRDQFIPIEYYLVSDIEKKKAIFDKNGNLVVDFIACQGLQFDIHTQTVVSTSMQPNNRLRSFLHDLEGNLLFDTSFESIAFISHSDLIALIVEDGPNDEYFLYNPFTKDKIGPIDHFNIYNENSNQPFGMEPQEFEKYKELNVIAIRKMVNNDYLWGILDIKGHEIIPMEYKNLGIFSTADKNHNAYKRAKKPEGVEFLFKGSHQSNRSTTIYFDSNFDKYEHKIISIPKNEYAIEKM